MKIDTHGGGYTKVIDRNKRNNATLKSAFANEMIQNKTNKIRLNAYKEEYTEAFEKGFISERTFRLLTSMYTVFVNDIKKEEEKQKRKEDLINQNKVTETVKKESATLINETVKTNGLSSVGGILIVGLLALLLIKK